MIVALFGPSGSGKSTLLKKIKCFSEFADKNVAVKKEDDFISIRFLKSIFGHKPFSNYKKIKFFEKKPTGQYELFSFLVQFFYPFFVYIEFFFEYLYYEVFFRKKILLRDRYIYDYFVTFKDILKINSWIIRFFYISFPKPSLLFYLSIDKETALKRNKNNIPNKITTKESFHAGVLNTYEQMAQIKNILTIDNNKSLQKATLDLNFHISNRMAFTRIKSLAIIGLDGSGKSTLSNALCDYASQLNLKCKIVHFYHDNLLYKFLKNFGFFRDTDVMISTARVKKDKTILWAFLTWIDSYVQYLYARLLYGRGLIIFDRYFYDYLVSFKYLNIKRISILKQTIPPIAYSIWVSCDPRIALGRKPENTLDFFVSGYYSYKELAQEYDMKIIDSTKGNWKKLFEEVLSSISKK